MILFSQNCSNTWLASFYAACVMVVTHSRILYAGATFVLLSTRTACQNHLYVYIFALMRNALVSIKDHQFHNQHSALWYTTNAAVGCWFVEVVKTIRIVWKCLLWHLSVLVTTLCMCISVTSRTSWFLLPNAWPNYVTPLSLSAGLSWHWPASYPNQQCFDLVYWMNDIENSKTTHLKVLIAIFAFKSFECTHICLIIGSRT